MVALRGGEAVEEAWAGVGLLNTVLSLICVSSGEARFPISHFPKNAAIF